MSTSCTDSWKYSAALAALPLQTPRRLRMLLRAGEPQVVWNMLRNKERPLVGIDNAVWKAWHDVPASLLETTAENCINANVTVATFRDPNYPVALIGDHNAPPVLFMVGHPSLLQERRVGIVGTRTATRSGQFFARTLGEQLANEKVCVVSGLARGIDVESHVGALSANGTDAVGPCAVVASGPDVVYPREHKRIWEQVVERGVLVSEFPPGVAPETHRFPMRNRILAGLSEVLVVVESRARGGSMITVREAMKRDITVMAVPGAPGVRASEGTNDLLRDGCAPVTCVEDVLVMLGLSNGRRFSSVEMRETPTAEERCVLAALGRSPRTIDEVALLATLSVVDVAVLLGRLEAKGWIAHSNGWWEALVA